MGRGQSYNQTDLGYPPWALDFDPYNRGYLLVSGGGGEGQKEVPNKITLLDISQRGATSKAAEINTGSTDDCPVSLGVLSTKDGMIAYAGINSGKQERRKAVNKHFRSYKIDYPARSKDPSIPQSIGNVTPLDTTTLFSPSYAQSDDAFQRLLRVSPAAKRAGATKRIGAVANSLAKESEIVVFDATAATPAKEHIITRIRPLQNAEANDLDIVESSEGEFQLTFCTNTEVYAQTITYDFASRKGKLFPKEPYPAHKANMPDAFQKPGRPRFRSIRFITDHHLLILANRGSQSELLVLRIFPDGTDGDLVLRKQLPRRMGAAVSMDVCLLDEDPTTGAKQIIVAVAAQSQDITVFTVDYSGRKTDAISTFTQYSDLREVHPMAMKKVALSPFFSPWPSSTAPDQNKKPGPQYIRLASISLSNTVVIDDLPVKPLQPGKRGSRYILQKGGSASATLQRNSSFLVLFFMLGVSLILVQSYLNAQASGDQPTVQFIPASIQSRLNAYTQPITDYLAPYLSRAEQELENGIVDPLLHSQTVQKLTKHIHLGTLRDSLLSSKHKTRAIVVRAPDGGELSTEVHAHTDEILKADVNAKKWEELSAVQQQRWRSRLVDAGAWTASEGETILKGMFFSELGGAIGRAAAQAMAG